MKLAVIADIHANLEALEAVLAHAAAQGVDEIVCLGDVVGYGASPAECVEILMRRKIPTIRGNHERMLLEVAKNEVRKETMEAIAFTQEMMGPDQMKWVEALPDHRIHRDEYLLVHGSPRDPDEYCNAPERYASSIKKMKSTYGGLELCFFGHTHFPVVASREKVEETIHADRSVSLKRREIYLINPGSVGQPRDSCPKSSYVVYDSDAHEVHFFRIDYDIEGAKRRIKEAGLSPKLASRLTFGK